MVSALAVCGGHWALVCDDDSCHSESQYPSRKQGDLALDCCDSCLWLPLVSHVWRTAPVQKRNGPAEKYGINEVSRRQQQTITRGTQAREQGSLWYGQIHSIHGPQCRSL